MRQSAAMRSSGLLFLMLSACATVPSKPPEIPVSQVGIAFDRNGNVGSFSEGLADPAAGRAVTPDDPVRIASISKLVVGIGVMKLVEQGKLGLDEDVSRQLGWTLRNPAFPDRPITLRQLLSHTSSVRDFQDQYAIPLGGSVQATMAAPHQLGPEARAGRRFFHLFEPQFPDRRFDHRAHDRRALRPMDAPRGDRADEARRLLQLADLQRREGRAGRRSHAGRQGGPRRSRRQASGLPGVRRRWSMRSSDVGGSARTARFSPRRADCGFR